MVEVVAAQGCVAAGGHDLEHALAQAQQRHVEGAAAQVVHRVQALDAMVQPIGHRRGGRLVDQPQHLQAGQLGGSSSPGAVHRQRRGHGDDRAEQLVVETVLGTLT